MPEPDATQPDQREVGKYFQTETDYTNETRSEMSNLTTDQALASKSGFDLRTMGKDCVDVAAMIAARSWEKSVTRPGRYYLIKGGVADEVVNVWVDYLNDELRSFEEIVAEHPQLAQAKERWDLVFCGCRIRMDDIVQRNEDRENYHIGILRVNLKWSLRTSSSPNTFDDYHVRVIPLPQLWKKIEDSRSMDTWLFDDYEEQDFLGTIHSVSVTRPDTFTFKVEELSKLGVTGPVSLSRSFLFPLSEDMTLLE